MGSLASEDLDRRNYGRGASFNDRKQAKIGVEVGYAHSDRSVSHRFCRALFRGAGKDRAVGRYSATWIVVAGGTGAPDELPIRLVIARQSEQVISGVGRTKQRRRKGWRRVVPHPFWRETRIGVPGVRARIYDERRSALLITGADGGELIAQASDAASSGTARGIRSCSARNAKAAFQIAVTCRPRLDADTGGPGVRVERLR